MTLMRLHGILFINKFSSKVGITTLYSENNITSTRQDKCSGTFIQFGVIQMQCPYSWSHLVKSGRLLLKTLKLSVWLPPFHKWISSKTTWDFPAFCFSFFIRSQEGSSPENCTKVQVIEVNYLGQFQCF